MDVTLEQVDKWIKEQAKEMDYTFREGSTYSDHVKKDASEAMLNLLKIRREVWENN